MCIGENYKHIAENAIDKRKDLNIMKRTISILFSLALLCCSLTACGSMDNNKDSAAENPTVAQNESSGLNSATDASMQDAGDGIYGDSSSTDRNNANTPANDSSSKSDGLVDDLVSKGEDIVDDAGSAIENAGDALTGTDSKND